MTSPVTGFPPAGESRKSRRWLLVLVTCLVSLVVIGGLASDARVPFRNDFAAYWPVGRLLLMGENPYDSGAIEAVQTSVGDTLGGDSVVRYPPWSLPLLLPLAALPYAPGWYLWILLQVILVGVSSVWLWSQFNGRREGNGVALAIGLLFPPSLIMAIGGQIGGVLLLAATAFLWAAKRHRDVVAGVCLGVLATKPHLFIPLGIVVILWAAYERRPIVPAATGLAIVLGSVLAISLRPAIFPEYLQFVREQAPTGYLPVSVGGLIRLIGGTGKFWIQWIPAAAVLVLIPLVWSRIRKTWTWEACGAGILALGLVAAPYGLVHDLVLLIPCLLLLAMTVRQHPQILRRLVLWGYVAMCLGIWFGQIMRGSSFVQVWVAPLVLLACIAIRRDRAA